MNEGLQVLIDLLDLEPIEVNIFRGSSSDEKRQRVFGGQVIGQALVAAGRTVERGMVHSLHSYFLRPGDPTAPILYEVDRIRDGRSFTTRRVVAIQHGRAIFNLSASFHVEEPGEAHQFPMPDVADPETLPTWREYMAPYKDRMGDEWDRPRPLDIRYPAGPIAEERGPRRPPRQFVWMRADGRLPDDPMMHACVAAYASDMTALNAAMIARGAGWNEPDLFVASLDHVMWFHRPFRADDWLLFDHDSPVSARARALGRGLIYTRDGTLVVSVGQEGLIRTLR